MSGYCPDCGNTLCVCPVASLEDRVVALESLVGDVVTSEARALRERDQARADLNQAQAELKLAEFRFTSTYAHQLEVELAACKESMGAHDKSRAEVIMERDRMQAERDRLQVTVDALKSAYDSLKETK